MAQTGYAIEIGLFFVVVVVVLGFELRASGLQSRHCTAWATSPVHFALVILDMESCKLFVFLISASQVARSTGMSHQHLLEICFWMIKNLFHLV
jgi:hypothetical protein